jgi:hypothetical protein
VSEWGLLGCWSIMVRLHDAIEVVSVEEIRLLSCLLLFAFMSKFSLHLWSSNHKSTQTCLHRCLDGFEDGNQGYQQNPEDDY